MTNSEPKSYEFNRQYVALQSTSLVEIKHLCQLTGVWIVTDSKMAQSLIFVHMSPMRFTLVVVNSVCSEYYTTNPFAFLRLPGKLSAAEGFGLTNVT